MSEHSEGIELVRKLGIGLKKYFEDDSIAVFKLEVEPYLNGLIRLGYSSVEAVEATGIGTFVDNRLMTAAEGAIMRQGIRSAAQKTSAETAAKVAARFGMLLNVATYVFMMSAPAGAEEFTPEKKRLYQEHVRSRLNRYLAKDPHAIPPMAPSRWLKSW